MRALSEPEFRDAITLLKQLIQIDTSNPPGNERPAAEMIADKLRAMGLTPELVGPSDERPNLVCRLAASKPTERPLILSCHLDVVPAGDPAEWTHPPFSGVEADGCIWGRGSIDMKGFAAMALTVFRHLQEVPRNRDIIFVAVADEEAGTEGGSRWLVDQRPDLLGDRPEYVINEVGGFTLHRKGRRFYPIQVAEKGVAWLRMTASGAPGHASLPAPDSAVAKLTRATSKLSQARLPWHVSLEAAHFIRAMANEQGWIERLFAPLLLNPFLGPHLLPLAVPAHLRPPLEAILRNTATPTVLRAGEKTNVLPSIASCEVDGRLAPGQTAEDLIRELTSVVADDSIQFEILETHLACASDINTPLYASLCDGIRRHDPGSFPVPNLVQGFTDSHNYTRLGAQCYGFYPLQMPESIEFSKLFHGTDERIPIDGFRWGIEVLADVLETFVNPAQRGVHRDSSQ